jgi:para-nitrobenzyl esterase
MSTRRSVLNSLTVGAALLTAWACNRLPPPPKQPVTIPATASPGDVAPALAAEVVDTTWQWVSLTTPAAQVSVDAPDTYTIRFGHDGRVEVRADCNRGTTTYTAGADRKIEVKPLALTRAMCPPGSLSDRFLKEVTRATSYFLKDGDLYLQLPVDSGTLRFRRPA